MTQLSYRIVSYRIFV